MNYDIKNILLGVLILLSAFFFYKWYFSTDEVAKAENKKLEIENIQLKKERARINKANDSITIHYKKVEDNIYKTLDAISNLEVKFDKLEDGIVKSRQDLENNQKKINEQLKQIQYLKEHPTKRIGDDLIKSLNEKINENK